MLVAGFLDAHLIHIFEFSFNEQGFTSRLQEQLERRFPTGDITSEYLRSAQFSFIHYKDAESLKTIYIASKQELTKAQPTYNKKPILLFGEESAMNITNQHLLKDNSLENKQITTDTLGEGKLIEGDTLSVLSKIDDDVVNVGVTSPPYNKQEKQKGWLVKNVVYDTYKDAVPEPEYQQHQVDVLNEIYRVTASGGSFFYNHKIRWDRGNMYHPMDWLRETQWTVKQEIIWDRVIAANIRGWRFWQVEEPYLLAV